MTYPQQVARLDCPISSCKWTMDEPELPVLTMPGDSGIPGLVKEHYLRVEAVLRAHVETHELAEWVREVVDLRTRVPAPLPDLTAVPWRQGRSHPANLWAATGEDWREHRPAGRMDSGELAAEACAAHNVLLDLRWLLAGGFVVSVARYLAFEPLPAVMPYEVVLRDLEGEHVLTVDGQPTLGEALAEARTQAEGAAP